MGIALYRKYRPQSFVDMTGQNHIRVTLENELASGAVAHAYLFTGPRGVGKTSMARIFARALNCLNRPAGKSEPCNTCEACREAQTGRSLDIVEIDAASNTGVDNVRENIIERVRFAPSSRRYKVFIIDEVHMLSASAWNALLKTLEEPPSHAVFIMATTEIHKVPATIISRCQRFDFKRIPAASMAERLKGMGAGEGITVDDAVISAVVGLSDGCLRDAESLFEQVLSLGEKNISLTEAALVLPRSNPELVIGFIAALAKRDGAAAISAIERLVGEGVDLAQFVGECLEYLRGVLLFSLGAPAATNVPDAIKQMPTTRLSKLMSAFLVARLELKSTPIPQLPLELLAAEQCAEATLSQAPSSNHQVPNKISNEKNQTPAPVVVNKIKEPIVEAKPVAAPPVEPKPVAEVKTVVSPVAATPTTIAIPLETLALRWDELCAAVQEENPSLPFLLRVARPIRFEGNELVIGVQYKMHAEKLNTAKNKDSVIRGLTALYNGANISVRAEIAPPDEAAATGAVTDSLLSQFGGSVVQ